MRPDRLSVRFPQAKGISGFGNPAEKEGQKRKRKIKLNGVENGMIPRKKQIKKETNGVSGFGNLMSRKRSGKPELFRHIHMLLEIPPEYPVKLMAGDLKGKNRLLT